MESILVVYATKYGSTKEVAEAIAETLRTHGLEVDVRAAGDPVDPSDYSAVVVGGAFYYFRWLKAAHKFIRSHRGALETLPVAVFGMGPWSEDPAKFAEELSDVRTHLDKALAKHEWLAPVAATVFGGAFFPDRLKFPDNNPAMRQIPTADARDWETIRAWAESLPAAFGLEPSGTGGSETYIVGPLDADQARVERSERIETAISKMREAAEHMPEGTDETPVIRRFRDAPEPWVTPSAEEDE